MLAKMSEVLSELKWLEPEEEHWERRWPKKA